MSEKAKEDTKKLLSKLSRGTSMDSSIIRIMFNITELFYLEANRLLKPHNITLEQSALLAHLYANDGISQKNLAKHVFKDQANTTRILKRMLEKGFVRRVSPEHDRRQNLIYLTEQGEYLVEEIVPKVYEAHNSVLKTLGRQEADHLKESLFRFYENVVKVFSK